jgi:hypothetical protein
VCEDRDSADVTYRTHVGITTELSCRAKHGMTGRFIRYGAVNLSEQFYGESPECVRIHRNRGLRSGSEATVCFSSIVMGHDIR